jgi:hypothetical protein
VLIVKIIWANLKEFSKNKKERNHKLMIYYQQNHKWIKKLEKRLKNGDVFNALLCAAYSISHVFVCFTATNVAKTI